MGVGVYLGRHATSTWGRVGAPPERRTDEHVRITGRGRGGVGGRGGGVGRTGPRRFVGADEPTTTYPGAAPATDNAATVIGHLQSSGYKVTATQYGSLPLAQCRVPSVQPGQAITTPQTTDAKAVFFVTLYTTVYVTADCTKPASSSSSSSSGG
jgi:hypothetical protein